MGAKVVSCVYKEESLHGVSPVTRLEEEDSELDELSPDELARTTTTTTTTEKAYYPGKLPLLLG